MSNTDKPRLRFFEQSPGQRHIAADDKYLYAANDPEYRVNVIGTGTIGQEHMRVAALLGRARVHGIFDPVAHSMDVAGEDFARHAQHGLVQYKDLESACQDPEVDALMLCTPNFTHFDVLTTAMESGKAIFLEKPMATTLEDAGRIVELCSSYESVVQVGLQYRYKAPYVEARHEVLERRSLGEVRTVAMSEYRPPFLDKVGQWNKFNQYSGGTLVEKCCHYFDLLSLFAASDPVRVYASSGQAVNFVNFTYEGERSDIDDHAYVIIDYRNGVRANFTLNMFSPHFYEELVVSGDAGRLVATERFDFLQQDRSSASVALEKGEPHMSRKAEVAYPRLIEQSGHHGATWFEHIAFADQLKGEATDAATPLQGLWSVIVASAAQESSANGAAIDVDELIERHDLGRVLGR